jgi:acyl carrier protein
MDIDINQEVLVVLQEQFDIDASKVSPESRLREDLDLDSIDLCDMMSVIEKRMGVSTELSDFMNAQTVSDFVRILETMAKQNPSA